MVTQENIPYTADEIKAMVKTIEELRKKYNGALVRAKVYHTGGSISDAHITEVIFPELKDDNDERIRKGLIKAVSRIFEGHKLFDTDVTREEALVWLEKQGEKMTKPKFNVGDWITDGRLTCKVLGVTGKSYELHLHNDDYCHFETDIQSVDKYYRLWAIEDAKDGDVLVAKDDRPFIFTGEFDVQDDNPTAYCGINSSDKFITGKGSHWTFKDGIKPATKEQRELLFSKMKEAGYEWDAEKKEAKKIELASKESEDERMLREIKRYIKEQGDKPTGLPNGTVPVSDMLTWLEKQGKEEYALKSFKDEDVHEFMQYIEKQAKAYDFNLPNRGYDIYAFAKDILIWFEKQGEPKDKEEEISDGYHTFNELCRYRMLYNAECCETPLFDNPVTLKKRNLL